MKTHSKITALVLTLALSAGGSFLLAQPAINVPAITPPSGAPTAAGRGAAGAGQRRGGGGQPRMEMGLVSLEEARRHLDAAAPDKGGFRVKAIASIDAAIKDVQEGIEYARTHPEEFRGGGARGAGTDVAAATEPLRGTEGPRGTAGPRGTGRGARGTGRGGRGAGAPAST